jgi:hypothetical protein
VKRRHCQISDAPSHFVNASVTNIRLCNLSDKRYGFELSLFFVVGNVQFTWLRKTVTLDKSTELRRKEARKRTIWPDHELSECRALRSTKPKMGALNPACLGWRTGPGARLAEGVGFEPTIRFPVYTLSKRAPSATRPPLRARRAQYSGGLRHDNPHGTGPIAKPQPTPAAMMEPPARSVVNRQSLMRQHGRMSWDVGYCFGSSAFRCRSFC